jgi:hypothetical protein
MRSRSKLALVAALLAVIGGLLWWLHTGDGTATTEAAAPEREVYRPGRAIERPQVGAPLPLVEGGAPTVALLEQRLADYKAVSVYPHWSRPLGEETIDKLDWNRTIVSDLPMDDRPGHELVYRFGADRWSVPHGEAFVSWIEVAKPGDGASRLPVEVLEAELVSVGSGRVTSLVYRDDGMNGDEVAGDHRYTNRLVPSQFPALAEKAQQVHIEALIRASGVTRPITRDFAYAPRRVAEITGATEQLRDGHLVVTLQVNVAEKGLYTFSANVFGADGAPIAFGEKSYPLEPGKHSADVVMFGRAFHEKAIEGPYIVRDIRGMRRFIDTDEQNYFFTYGKELRTRRYAHADFSGAEWDEPERRETIASFQRVIDETRYGEIGYEDDEGHAQPTVTPGGDPPLPFNPPSK